ncbi:uncharacterized protein [Physcomitrium patens]|nr:uncharacterized protein LOC112283415 [Physcomitrium patens]|eukprot:XP_024377813.1 uncharacterized protein LOC112283415 [Physcomitrella patens]
MLGYQQHSRPHHLSEGCAKAKCQPNLAEAPHAASHTDHILCTVSALRRRKFFSAPSAWYCPAALLDASHLSRSAIASAHLLFGTPLPSVVCENTNRFVLFVLCTSANLLMETFPWEDGDPPDRHLQRKSGDDADEEQVQVQVQAFSKVVSTWMFVAATTGVVAGRSVQMGLSRWDGGDAFLVSSSSIQCCGSPCLRFDGLGLETAGREGDAHGVTPPGFGVAEVGSYEQLQLDLGLTDITKYFSYSKLWRLLYFINDAPFRIHKYAKTAGGQCRPSPAGLLGIT